MVLALPVVFGMALLGLGLAFEYQTSYVMAMLSVFLFMSSVFVGPVMLLLAERVAGE